MYDTTPETISPYRSPDARTFTPDEIPGAFTVSHCAEPVGYVSPGGAVCPDCATDADTDPDPSDRLGDDNSWPVFNDMGTDSPTHCGECGTIIGEALTDEGYRYIMAAADEGGPVAAGWLMNWLNGQLIETPEWWKAETLELVRVDDDPDGYEGERERWALIPARPVHPVLPFTG